jgi:hypothetical protein
MAAAIAAGQLAVAPATPARGALAAIGVDDALSVRHDRTAIVPAPGVLGNDANLLGGTTAILTQDVSHGTLTLRSDGGYTYTPDPGYVGSDSFDYRPSGLLSTGATVRITVTNATPIARTDAYSTPSRTTLVVPAPGVLGNDTDADGDTLQASLVSASGISGSVDLDPDGALTYSPGGGFSGSVSFTYRVTDGIAWSSTVTVTLTVASPTPTPTPTPSPVPTPTPTPRPTATPLLPLPSLPLPSLPPLPSLLPRPIATPRPTEPAASGGPRPSSAASPSPTSAPSDGSRPSPTPSEAGAPASPGSSSGGPGVANPGSPGGAARPADGARTLIVDPADAELGLGTIDLALNFGVYAVPAAVIAGPGVLLLLWVALQTFGALAWVPAVRRLRGRDERGTAR